MFELLLIVTDNPWVHLLMVSIGIQWAVWPLAVYFQTEKFYDLVGSATFIVVSHLSHSSSSMTNRQNIVSSLIFAWACRLGIFLFLRVLKNGGDRRFDKAKSNPMIFFKFWTIQGLWVFVTLLPTITLNMSNKRNPSIGLRDYIGWTIWGFGFVIEVIADMQKSIFATNPNNKGKFIQSGLWSISRHPNYFGEITLWFGLYLTCSSVFQGIQYFTIISPIMVMLLLTRLSGVPILEQRGKQQWGRDEAYQKYLKDVPTLIPFIKT